MEFLNILLCVEVPVSEVKMLQIEFLVDYWSFLTIF